MSWRQRNVSAKKKDFSKKSLLQAEWKQIKDLQSLNDVKTCNFSKTMLMIRYLYEIVPSYLLGWALFWQFWGINGGLYMVSGMHERILKMCLDHL